VRSVVGEEAEEGLLARGHLRDGFVREPIGEIGMVDFLDRFLVSEEFVFFGRGKIVVAASVHAEEEVEAFFVWKHAGNGVADVPLADD